MVLIPLHTGGRTRWILLLGYWFLMFWNNSFRCCVFCSYEDSVNSTVLLLCSLIRALNDGCLSKFGSHPLDWSSQGQMNRPRWKPMILCARPIAAPPKSPTSDPASTWRGFVAYHQYFNWVLELGLIFRRNMEFSPWKERLQWSTKKMNSEFNSRFVDVWILE